jgi:hypothetical protein
MGAGVGVEGGARIDGRSVHVHFHEGVGAVRRRAEVGGGELRGGPLALENHRGLGERFGVVKGKIWEWCIKLLEGTDVLEQDDDCCGMVRVGWLKKYSGRSA